MYSFSEGKTQTTMTGLSDDAQSRAYCSNRLGSRPVTRNLIELTSVGDFGNNPLRGIARLRSRHA